MVIRYDYSIFRFSWHDFESTKRRTVRCDEKANTNKGIYVEIGLSVFVGIFFKYFQIKSCDRGEDSPWATLSGMLRVHGPSLSTNPFREHAPNASATFRTRKFFH
jgi:hypothetical protein